MRTIIKCFLILLMTFFCACGNDEPYRLPLDEFEPIKIRFKFVDKDGSDLLDPSNPKNVLDSCYARFKEVVYKPDQSFEINPNDEKSKVNFQGLRLVKLEDKYAILSFKRSDRMKNGEDM